MELFLQQLINGLTQGMGYALIALGLTMIFGVLHIINFSHGEFYMLGGLVSVLVTTSLGLSYALAALLAIVALCAVAWVVDLLAVTPVLDKRDGPSTVLLTTYAVSLLINQSVLQAWGPNPARVEGIEGSLVIGSVVVGYHRLLVLAAGVGALALIETVLRRTNVGRKIRALAQSAYAATVVGINITSVRRITFIGAAALAGLTGALLTPISLYTPTMGQHIITNAFVVVVIGGMGNAWGAVVCGILLGVVEAMASIFMPHEVGTAIVYTLLLAALLIRPQGLFGGSRA